MANRLNLILLVDDDEATNFLHKIMVTDANCTENIHVCKNGKDAINYVLDGIEGKHALPELIFLDINMPVMNGWDFLDDYQNLPAEQKAKMKVVMLTTSINPDDFDKSKEYADVADFRNKPLTSELICEVIGKHFTDN